MQLGFGLSLAGVQQTLIQRAIAVLRRFGSDAHIYLPGVGMLNGLQAGNHLDSAGTTDAEIDGPVGLVLDAMGGINATQPTTASKPILRRGAVCLALNSAAPATQSITSIAGPYTLALIGTGSTVLSGTGAGTLTGTGATDLVALPFTATAGSVTLTPSGSVTRFALFAGTYTAAQIQALGGIPTTTTAPASTALGPQYWQFDGSNDSLSLGSAPFGLIDDFVIVAGAYCGTSPSWSSLFSNSGAGTTPRIQLLIDSANGFVKCYFRDDAGVNVAVNGAIDYRGKSVVLTIRKIGTAITLRANGVLVSTGSTSALGAATFTASALGMLAGGTDYFNGGLNNAQLVKGTVPDADLLLLEKFVGQLSGVQI